MNTNEKRERFKLLIEYMIVRWNLDKFADNPMFGFVYNGIHDSFLSGVDNQSDYETEEVYATIVNLLTKDKIR